MIDDQNQGQEPIQGQEPSRVDALMKEIADLKAQMNSFGQMNSFPSTVEIEKIPTDKKEFEVFVRQHLDAHLPEQDRRRMLNYDMFKDNYVRAVYKIRENWDDYKRIVSGGDDLTGRDINIVNEVRQNVSALLSFRLRVPRDSAYRLLINPDNEVFKYRSKREKFGGY
jgi:hypothetical protein